MAYSFKPDPKAASEHYRQAAKILHQRMDELAASQDEKDQAEARDLKDIVAQLEEKVSWRHFFCF